MIVNFKKRRYKPLYKKFILLRKNIQNRRRLNLLKFKKRKWKGLILYLKRFHLRRKKKFAMFDVNRHFLPKMFNSFKRKFSYALRNKLKLKLFYGGLSERYIKNLVQEIVKRKSSVLRKYLNFNSLFLNSLESRLDVVLYRAHFSLSIRSARQSILHKHITVNNNIVNDCSYTLKKGDIIKVNFKGYKTIENSVKSSHIWPIPPKYLNVNYKILQILFNGDKGDYKTFSTFFSFWLDFATILRLYR